MPRYVFDIETNGLLDDLTKIHSLVLMDVDTGDMHSFGPGAIEGGLQMLMDADQIIGHNIIKFDIPAIQKVYPWCHIDRDKVFDTLVMSRLIWPNLSQLDTPAIKKGMPGNLRGSHGLEAWGYRLNEWKGDYSKEMKDKGLDPWAEWNPEMQAYCEQDVRATKALLDKIDSKGTDPKAIELEHRVAWIIAQQERNGFLFDTEKAERLLADLQVKRAEIEGELQNLFEPWFAPAGLKEPKRTVNYKSVDRHSTWAGAPYTEVNLNVFNPGSRHHIADRLMKVRGWKPDQFTDKGQVKVDENVLLKLKYPEAQKIGEYLMLQKRIGQLAEGKQGWLNQVHPDGRIHGSVNSNGAVTGRMTHSHPNVAQVPSVGAPYGAECRELFKVPQGKKLVGIDVSGLELRMLAHYMNDPNYTREVVEGDVHTANQKAAGLPTRNNAKTFIYAFLYGAGDEKIGKIVGKGAKEGKRLKRQFLEATPALKGLINGVQKAAKTRGYLKGLDGRKLHVRSAHSALNTLLQSAGALVCKRWIVEFEDALQQGLGDHVKFVANVHDEIQLEVDAEFAEAAGELAVECIGRAGDYFNVRVPLTGEYKVGANWKETH